MTSPFKLIDLPSGEWAVSWSDQLVTTRFRLMPSNKQTLEIIFKELRLHEARLGVLTNNRELETIRIDALDYYQIQSRTVNYLACYIVAGAIFDTETQAQQFLQIVEKYHIMKVLKEPA